MSNQREEWLSDEQLTPCSNCDKKFEHPMLHIVDIKGVISGVGTAESCTWKLALLP